MNTSGNKSTRPTLWSREDLARELGEQGERNKKVVFTNGCFDLLHRGHLEVLSQARALGDVLVVAINSDASIVRLKGPDRPIINESERAELLAGLRVVDYVIIFDEDTPLEMITFLRPNVLVKGGDWGENEIVGSDVVEALGGKVVRVPVIEGSSSTNIIARMTG